MRGLRAAAVALSVALLMACSAGVGGIPRDAATGKGDGGAVGDGIGIGVGLGDSGGSADAPVSTVPDGGGPDSPIGDGGADGAPDADAGGDAGPACILAPGTYAVHYSGAVAGSPCPPLPPDTTFTIPGSGGPLPPNVTCTSATDQDSCTTTTDCTSTGGDLVVVSHSVTTLHPDGTESGTDDPTITQEGVVTVCPTVFFTYTKQ